MIREIATAVDAGRTDDQILEMMAANHGQATLLTPMFHGFDTLLWIVPISVVVLAVFGTFIAQRRRLSAAKHDPGETSHTS
jgi:cytochrome c-type biogenesis protein CcmH/NrfF